MSEYSRNQDTESMSRKRRQQVHATRLVLSFLTERHTIHPDLIPSRLPGAVGSVALPHEYGFNIQGDFVSTPLPVLERTDVAQLHRTTQLEI